MIYQWKTPLFPVSAQTAGEELDRIYQKYQALTPQNVVDESKDETAALHTCFEWNDEKAANAWRVQQARVLLCNITVTSPTENPTAEPTRAFVNPDSQYRPINIVLSDAELTKKLLDTALGELSAFRRKYESLIELANIMTEIRKLEAV